MAKSQTSFHQKPEYISIVLHVNQTLLHVHCRVGKNETTPMDIVGWPFFSVHSQKQATIYLVFRSPHICRY